MKSDAIGKEVKAFKEQNKNNPIIPIDIDGCIFLSDWYHEIEGLAIIDEREESFDNKHASPEILERINSSLTFTKKSKKLRQTAVAFLIFFAVSILATTIMFRQVGKAKAELKVTSRKVRQEQLQGYIYLSKIGMNTNSINALKSATKAYTDYRDVDSGGLAEKNLLDLYNNNEIMIRNEFWTGGMLSPEGNYINDGRVADISSKKLLFSEDAHEVSFSPDDGMAIVTSSGKLNIYKTKDTVLVKSIIIGDSMVSASFDMGNRFIFLRYHPPGEADEANRRVVIIDRSTQEIIADITVPYNSEVQDFVKSSGGIVLLISDSEKDRHAWLYHVSSGKTEQIKTASAHYLSIDYSFTGNGSLLEYSVTSTEETGMLKGTNYHFRFRLMNLTGNVLQDSVFTHLDLFHTDPNGKKAEPFHSRLKDMHLFGISGAWGIRFLLDVKHTPFKTPKKLVFGSLLNSYDFSKMIDTNYFLAIGYRNDEYIITVFKLDGEMVKDIFTVVNKNHPNGNIEDDAFMKSIAIAYNPLTKFLTIYDRGTGVCTKYLIDKLAVRSASEFVNLISTKKLFANAW